MGCLLPDNIMPLLYLFNNMYVILVISCSPFLLSQIQMMIMTVNMKNEDYYYYYCYVILIIIIIIIIIITLIIIIIIIIMVFYCQFTYDPRLLW